MPKSFLEIQTIFDQHYEIMKKVNKEIEELRDETLKEWDIRNDPALSQIFECLHLNNGRSDAMVFDLSKARKELSALVQTESDKPFKGKI